MKQIITTIFYIAAAAFVAGCSKDEVNNISENDILIEVEAPQTDGWSTENIAGTRSDETNIAKLEGEDGLDMTVNTQPDYTETPTDKATTRWANMDDNTTFRVVAYKCTAAASISTANYAGYGDYTLSGSIVKTTKSLALPVGTYTFICYSYGSSTAIAAFSNSSTSVSASNGQNFMTYVLPNITINITGGKYTLSNIVFKHRCARYRIQAIAQNGRMGNITACSGTVTLPNYNATYTFVNDAFVTHATSAATNVTWSNPNAMNVYSDYIYLLPQSSASITINLNPTIGQKAFTNKSITLTGLTFNVNGSFRSDVSFTTTEGYIIGGAMWANGNLYKSGSTYLFYDKTESYGATIENGNLFRTNSPNPYPDRTSSISDWTEANDPCRKLTSAPNKWRLPLYVETLLLSANYIRDATLNGVAGYKFGNVLFLPYSGYTSIEYNKFIDNTTRGLLWCTTPGKAFVYASINYNNGQSIFGYASWDQYPNNYYGIRCVRNI